MGRVGVKSMHSLDNKKILAKKKMTKRNFSKGPHKMLSCMFFSPCGVYIEDKL